MKILGWLFAIVLAVACLVIGVVYSTNIKDGVNNVKDKFEQDETIEDDTNEEETKINLEEETITIRA